METFSADIDVLTQKLKEHYPNDDMIVNWHNIYCKALIQQHVCKPDVLQCKDNDLETEFNKLKMEFKKLKLKESSKKCTSQPSMSNQGHKTSMQNRTTHTNIKICI